MSIKAVFPCNNFNAEKLLNILKSVLFKISYDIKKVKKNLYILIKIYSIYEYLQNQNENDIIIFSDAFDVFYVQSLKTIKERFIKHNTEI